MCWMLDQAGPFFGANALVALKAEGRPLSGLDIALEHKAYNWNEPTPLAQLVRELTSQGAIVAASSEGALFEDGSDEAIIMNLRALLWVGETGARLVAGSVTSADAFRRHDRDDQVQTVPPGH